VTSRSLSVGATCAGELYPHIGFIVTNYNPSRLAERVVASTILAVLAGHRCESPI
jgi:hypothetical protein